MTERPARTVLCWNQGSSSVKFAVYEMAAHEMNGVARRLAGGSQIELLAQHAGGLAASQQIHQEIPAKLACDAIERGLLLRPDVIGHRVVHGGPRLMEHCRLDDERIALLREAIPFAPLHMPAQIQAIEIFAESFPEVCQVACFDTAFHRSLPDVARMFPLPRDYWNRGLRRYGFHGLSFEYVASALGPALGAKAVIAHLGSGASMVALRDGLPVDTTMGLTPTGGLMMGTRSGDLDPGLLIYLLRQNGLAPGDLERLVNEESGLLGVSGITADMKTLLEHSSTNANAAAAVDMFCHYARKNIAALSASLGGLETLVFTGGIGERSAVVREKICQGLEYLGIAVDRQRNLHGEPVITTSSGRCAVRVIQTNEELIIARHAMDQLKREGG